MTHVGFRYSIEWANPYSVPPDGAPRVKAEMFETVEQRTERTSRGEKQVPPSFAELHVLGDGYALFIQAINTPPKELEQATLARVRQKRATRRIERRYPLFAEEFKQTELARKQDYYAGVTDAALQAARDHANAVYLELYERFLLSTATEAA